MRVGQDEMAWLAGRGAQPQCSRCAQCPRQLRHERGVPEENFSGDDNPELIKKIGEKKY